MKLKLNRLLDDFEFATYASAVLGVGDLWWVCTEIFKGSTDFAHFSILTMFIVGNIGLTVGLHKHFMRLKVLRARRCTNKTGIEASLIKEFHSYYDSK